MRTKCYEYQRQWVIHDKKIFGTIKHETGKNKEQTNLISSCKTPTEILVHLFAMKESMTASRARLYSNLHIILSYLAIFCEVMLGTI